MKTSYACSVAVVFFLASVSDAQGLDVPKSSDPRLVVELVAAAPDIVHPISCDFDHKGRLLVIESHTHFAPQGYKGPKFDRILAIDPRLAPGAEKRITTFFEGTRHTMDLAVHPDGSVYVATRNEILRLRESKGGVKSERIVFLDTKGDYPHNGLSGLCFDSKGDLTFGMGENLGAFYTLIGSDGAKFSGQGDGGHIFHCTAEGAKLRRVATGFWNPFGICRDIYGRTFAVDNDPDQAPPCRMLHVVEGGDYGFRFCYGRSGKHPFQSWHGTLPGTLPMMTGVGEAPCEILSYESDGLPKEYLGKLMVTSWADHRVELYKVVPHGASFKAERQPFVQGGNNFRPTGMCVAPDGSLYVADWVKSDYTLHGKGAIWHVRWKDAPKVKRPSDPKKAILSVHRPLREWAAKKLAREPRGGESLREYLDHADIRVRSAAMAALGRLWYLDAERIVENDADLGVRLLAFPGIRNGRPFLERKFPGLLRAEATQFVITRALAPKLLDFLDDDDPFLRHAAVHQMVLNNEVYLGINERLDRLNARQRIGFLKGTRRFDGEVNAGIVQPFLDDPDEMVRFLAVKWIADEKLVDYRKDIEKAMTDPKLSVRMYIACATALTRIDGKNVDERSLADYFAKRLADDSTPAAQRAMLLRQVPATHAKLTVELLSQLAKSKDDSLQFEAVRALAEHPNMKRTTPLLYAYREANRPTATRAFATLALSGQPEVLNDEFLEQVMNEGSPLREDIIRLMIGNRLSIKQTALLKELERSQQSADGIRRILDKPFFTARPPAKDIDAWLKRLEGKADADAGARIFFHPKLAACYKCHRIDGRGQDVGPDLSNIGNTDRRHILESILQPSSNVAPHYVAWHLETTAGKVKSGMLLHTHLDEYTYLDAKGDRFKLKTGDLVEQRPTTISIMPDGLIDRMTDQEVRDLLAYLQTRK